ncbi:hypothetical protein EV356DRAFT_213692 [Viridothelium virens]|uniref:Uncharacterized protein n=1 Tax=Viridothelium virens TaxID=1048519 RepID=A0A6A6H5N8_VIRVR|nr:hypothetical protein EV356DRAFT_213692 [Viridothelium virens]
MSDKLMDIEPGGESTQYESIHTVTKPHSKSGGQLGDASTEVDTTTAAQEEAKAARGERTAENIRYGQGISEHGMGGQTTTSGGVANTDGGYGGVREQVGKTAGSEGSDGAGRTEQGYGGERDMGRDVGA